MLEKRWEKSGITANDLLDLTRSYADQPGTCLLFSGGNFYTAQRSFLFLNPKQTIHLQGPFERNPWEMLKESLFFSSSELPQWVGFFSYEMGCFSDLEIEHPYQVSDVPDAFFQQAGTLLIYDHIKLTLTCHGEDIILPSKTTCFPVHIHYKPSQQLETQKSYIAKVEAAKELIFNGDIYQVNLSQQVVMEGEGHPFDIFSQTMQVNPAPFAAYIKQQDFTIVSTSPERFLSKKNGQLETRPIKGTAPRGKTLEEDHQNREQLITSPKEIAELLMITDLMRNDLGKVSLPGTVYTLDLGILETFTNVFHRHSWIVSKPQNMSSVDLIRSCFPGGSITGCPKIRAMQVISEMEKKPRGIYTGSIGYFCGDGDFDFNIAIRTMIFKDGKVSIRLGGGIVADSDPIKEYDETLYKGETLFKALSPQNS